MARIHTLVHERLTSHHTHILLHLVALAATVFHVDLAHVVTHATIDSHVTD